VRHAQLTGQPVAGMVTLGRDPGGATNRLAAAAAGHTTGNIRSWAVCLTKLANLTMVTGDPFQAAVIGHAALRGREFALETRPHPGAVYRMARRGRLDCCGICDESGCEHCPPSHAISRRWSPLVNAQQGQPDDPELAARIRFDVPHSARVWNYWLGGKDNYPADQAVGDAVLAVNPGLALTARQCRRFLVRAVRFLAGEMGIRQFLDIGTGLPTVQNTHEVAQGIAPESRIVYVDNDPLVLAHARALLTDTTPEGVTTYLHADVREPEVILADARNVLNFTQPIAVMLLGILGHAAPEFATMRSILARLMAGVPAGSYLVLMDGADTINEVYRAGVQRQAELGHPYHLRTVEQFTECFEGMELVDPGLVPVTQWRPDATEVGTNDPSSSAYSAVARKP
jgi:S-adenosyl methyltransferase